MTRNSKDALDSGVKVLSEYAANSIDSFNAMNISKIRSSRVMEYEDEIRVIEECNKDKKIF